MSVVGQKPAVDHMQPSGTFSYAQAAKGRPQPQSVSRPSSKENIGTIKANAEPSSGPLTAEGSKKSEERHMGTPANLQPSSAVEAEEIPVVEQPLSAETQEKVSTLTQPGPIHLSGHSTPDDKAASTSATSKQEDGLSMTNGTSDTSFEKANGIQADAREPRDTAEGTEIMESDKDQSTHSSQAEDAVKDPPAVVLKDAPPPAVNFWQQRMAQTQATSKAKTQPSQPQAQAPLLHGSRNAKGDSSETPIASIQDGARKPDARRRGRGSIGDERANSGVGKEPRRPFDTERGNNRLPRTSESRSSNIKANPPPPPNDAISWPTPDSAQDEEKKRTNERLEKPEKEKIGATKKWIPVQHVPSAVFNTPLPTNARRGGRPARGGREPNSRPTLPTQAVIPIEKSSNHGQVLAPLNGPSTERGRNEGQPNRVNTVDTKAKRASSAGAIAPKDRHRNPDGSASIAVSKDLKGSTTFIGPEVSSRAVSLSDTQKQTLEDSQPAHQNGLRGPNATEHATSHHGEKPAQSVADRYEKRNSFSQGSYSYSRSNGPERRSEYQGRSSNQPDQYAQNPIRERGDGRLERSRGGSYRGGRGPAHHGMSSSNNGHGQPMMNGAFSPHATAGQTTPARYNADPYNPMTQSGILSSAPSHYRNHRPSSRSNSMQHGAAYGRYASNPASVGPPLSNIQTEIANIYGQYPGGQVAMSAMPYNSYTDPMAMCNMVSMQMEYYLSVENLCKDLFLRKHMDSQGYVLLGVLTNFNRIRSLTQDLEIIRMACSQSSQIEFGTGPDGLDRVRKRHEWQPWILDMKDRDPTARNDGPAELQPVQIFQPPTYSASYGYNVRQVESARLAPANSRMDDVPFPMQNDLPGPSFPLRLAVGATFDAPATPTPLSAAVPEFNPQTSTTTRQLLLSESKTPNGLSKGVPAKDDLADLQTANLILLFKKPGASGAQTPAPKSLPNGVAESKPVLGEFTKLDRRPAIPLFGGPGSNDK